MNLKKIKSFFNNELFILALLTLLALLIRLLNIQNLGGLWYDEKLTYAFSAKNSILDVLNNLLKEDFHMPLYYFFLHFWTKIFGPSELALRLSSVLWGTLCVPAGYYLGKTFKSKSLGYFVAIITAVSPILIFYSQEVRLYSMITFISFLSITFFLKLTENSSKKHFVFFFLTNLIFLYVYSMAMILVGLEILVLLCHFYLYKKEGFKPFLKYLTIFIATSIPYLILLLSYMQASNQTLIGTLSWNSMNAFTPMSVVNDWFSPNLTGIYRQTETILQKTSLIATIFLIGFVLSLYRYSKKLIYLIFIFVSFCLITYLLCIIGAFSVVSRYMLIIWPIVILVCCNGLLTIKRKPLKTIIFLIIFLTYAYNIIDYKNAPSYSKRFGCVIPAKFLKEQRIAKEDYLFYTVRPELFKRSLDDSHYIDFSIDKILFLDKTKMEMYKLFDEKFIQTTNKNNSLDKLTPYLLDHYPTPQLKKYLNASIDKIPKGRKLVLITSNPNSEENIKKDINSYIRLYKNFQVTKEEYKAKLFTLIINKTLADIKTVLNQNPELKNLGQYQYDDKWVFFVYQKI